MLLSELILEHSTTSMLLLLSANIKMLLSPWKGKIKLTCDKDL
jgi:hypothetical protein